MLTNILILIAGIFAGGVILWFFVGRKKDKQEDGSLLMMQEQLKEIRSTLDSKLSETTKANQQQFVETTKVIQQQFGQSAKIIQDVTERLVKLDETNKQVVNFADQLKSLQDVLKNPKQRGVLGEYYLETVLKNVFSPNQFQMQYKFENGDIVDAVVFLGKDKILSVDSKFSLENYNRIVNENSPEEREKLEKVFKQDLKNRIDETAKYIRPKENTMDYAFMFIPSEAIYYDLLVNQVGAVKANTRDLIEYAYQQKHVVIVSPTTFMAYLSTVLQGLKALKIEESAKEIRKRVGELGRHLGNYEQFMKKLGANLSTTVNSYNSSYKELNKIDKDVLRITGEAAGIEPEILDKPETED
jgi:DNA recombination protein RmuC